MDFLQDAALARVRANGALDEYDLLNLRLLYPAEIEGCCLLLDSARRCIRRYAAGPPRPGPDGAAAGPGAAQGGARGPRGNAPPFYLVENAQKRGRRYLVIPEAAFCSCPYQSQGRPGEGPRVCKHLLACWLVEAAGLPVPESRDSRAWEDELYGALLRVAGSLPRAPEVW